MIERGESPYQPRGAALCLDDVDGELRDVAEALASQVRWRGVFLTEHSASEMRPAPVANDEWLVLETAKMYRQITTAGQRRRVSWSVSLENK